MPPKTTNYSRVQFGSRRNVRRNERRNDSMDAEGPTGRSERNPSRVFDCEDPAEVERIRSGVYETNKNFNDRNMQARSNEDIARSFR